MQRDSLLRLISERIYPTLRAAGFKGSGTTLRKVSGPVLHVFNVQGGSAGNGFFINLGATLSSLEMNGVTPATVATAKEYECVFRERIDPPALPGKAWPYPRNLHQTAETLETLAHRYATVGEPWFARYSTWPESFAALVGSGECLSVHPAHMFVLARIAVLLGNKQRAGVLGQAALECCPASASALRRDLEQLVSATRAA